MRKAKKRHSANWTPHLGSRPCSRWLTGGFHTASPLAHAAAPNCCVFWNFHWTAHLQKRFTPQFPSSHSVPKSQDYTPPPSPLGWGKQLPPKMTVSHRMLLQTWKGWEAQPNAGGRLFQPQHYELCHTVRSAFEIPVLLSHTTCLPNTSLRFQVFFNTSSQPSPLPRHISNKQVAFQVWQPTISSKLC